jgi:hypothetical protein
MGIKICNNLPLELKRIESFKVFKNKLKNFLLQKCFILHKFFSVTMMDGSLVTRVSFDMIWQYTDGL